MPVRQKATRAPGHDLAFDDRPSLLRTAAANLAVLRGSSPQALVTARALFREGLSQPSKAARCYLLVEDGNIDLPIAPRAAEPIGIYLGQSIEDAASAALGECLDQIATNVVVVRRLDDDEGPHQLRNGLRRLATVLSSFAPTLEPATTARLAGELHWLYSCAGGLRDLDVIDQHLSSTAATASADGAMQLLADECSQRSRNARVKLRGILAGARTREFLVYLAGFVETRGWTGDRVAFAKPYPVSLPVLSTLVLAQLWLRILAHVRDLDRLSTSERHDLRKRARRLRYTSELFRPLYAAPLVDPFLDSLRRLQTLLGDVNDAELVESALTGLAATHTDNPSVQRVIETVVEACKVRAESDRHKVQPLWRDLIGTRPFWSE